MGEVYPNRDDADRTQLDQLLRNKRRTQLLFSSDATINPQAKPDEAGAKKRKFALKMSNEYGKFKDLPATDEGGVGGQTTARSGPVSGPSAPLAITGPGVANALMLTDGSGNVVRRETPKTAQNITSALPKPAESVSPPEGASSSALGSDVQLSVYREKDQIVSSSNPNSRLRALEKPKWHRPWKLHKVIAGHTGWVRCVAVDSSNEWFVTSGQDRLIKFWDLASGKLKLSLTGHSATVRALDISKTHPYMYSGGEDNEVRCWDLNTNKIIRTYHGHLSAVYSLKLHPTIDVLASGGRDGTVRIWDIRTRTQIFALGHEGAVNTIVAQQSEPQFISGSADNTVKLWDLAAGKSMVTLTHHKKSIRAMAIHPSEYTFVSCSAENNKVWRSPAGVFERNIYGHDSIINACAIRDNQDGSSILAAGGDDGYLNLWDWKTGYLFQSIEGKPQPGSLSSENAIYGMAFDQSQTRLITTECDKTIKIYREDMEADENSHPIGNWRQQLMRSRRR